MAVNKRLRQWMKAMEMLESHDPLMMAFVPDDAWKCRKILVFRRSALEVMKAKYGDGLEVIGSDV